MSGSPGADGASTTVRPSRMARSIAASITSRRSGQWAAEAQPLSTTSNSGPVPAKLSRSGLSTGRASANTMRAASNMRSAVSHQGLCAGVSSVDFRSFNSRVGGNTTCCGVGGVSRNSHQIAGRAARPSSIQGCRKPMAPRLIMIATSPRLRRQREASTDESDNRAQGQRGDCGWRAPPPRPACRYGGEGTTSSSALPRRQARCGGL